MTRQLSVEHYHAAQLGQAKSKLSYHARRIASAQQHGKPIDPHDVDQVARLKAQIRDLEAGKFRAPVEDTEAACTGWSDPVTGVPVLTPPTTNEAQS